MSTNALFLSDQKQKGKKEYQASHQQGGRLQREGCITATPFNSNLHLRLGFVPATLDVEGRVIVIPVRQAHLVAVQIERVHQLLAPVGTVFDGRVAAQTLQLVSFTFYYFPNGLERKRKNVSNGLETKKIEKPLTQSLSSCVFAFKTRKRRQRTHKDLIGAAYVLYS